MLWIHSIRLSEYLGYTMVDIVMIGASIYGSDVTRRDRSFERKRRKRRKDYKNARDDARDNARNNARNDAKNDATKNDAKDDATDVHEECFLKTHFKMFQKTANRSFEIS